MPRRKLAEQLAVYISPIAEPNFNRDEIFLFLCITPQKIRTKKKERKSAHWIHYFLLQFNGSSGGPGFLTASLS